MTEHVHWVAVVSYRSERAPIEAERRERLASMNTRLLPSLKAELPSPFHQHEDHRRSVLSAVPTALALSCFKYS
jgi:hypothetical protein